MRGEKAGCDVRCARVLPFEEVPVASQSHARVLPLEEVDALAELPDVVKNADVLVANLADLAVETVDELAVHDDDAAVVCRDRRLLHLDVALAQAHDNDDVACEIAEQRVCPPERRLDRAHLARDGVFDAHDLREIGVHVRLHLDARREFDLELDALRAQQVDAVDELVVDLQPRLDVLRRHAAQRDLDRARRGLLAQLGFRQAGERGEGIEGDSGGASLLLRRRRPRGRRHLRRRRRRRERLAVLHLARLRVELRHRLELRHVVARIAVRPELLLVVTL